MPGLGHPLLGFVRLRLSSDMRPSVHSRVPFPASFGRTLPRVRSRSVSAVSHRSDGLLRSAVAGLLRPAAGHEVLRVSGFRAEDPKVLGLVCRPHGAVHTPRRIPLVGSRAASLRSLPSCRCRSPHPSCLDRPPSSPLGPGGPGGGFGAGPPRVGGCPREIRPKPSLRRGPSRPRNPGRVVPLVGASPTSGLPAWGPFHVCVWFREGTTGAVPRAKPPKWPPLGSGPRSVILPSSESVGAVSGVVRGMRARSAWTSQATRLRALSRPACSHREDGASVRGRGGRIHLGGVSPVQRPACADRLGPAMDPGLAAGGVHPGPASPTCRSRSSRPPSGASSSGPSLPFDRRSGRSTRALRSWWSLDVRLAAASGSRLRVPPKRRVSSGSVDGFRGVLARCLAASCLLLGGCPPRRPPGPAGGASQ
jgi:hypothetical protein